MEGLVSILIIVLLVAIFFGESLFGVKCPICGSRKHWSTRYWGSNKDYDEEFCANCYKSLYNPKTGEFITFNTSQDWK